MTPADIYPPLFTTFNRACDDVLDMGHSVFDFYNDNSNIVKAADYIKLIAASIFCCSVLLNSDIHKRQYSNSKKEAA